MISRIFQISYNGIMEENEVAETKSGGKLTIIYWTGSFKKVQLYETDM